MVKKAKVKIKQEPKTRRPTNIVLMPTVFVSPVWALTNRTLKTAMLKFQWNEPPIKTAAINSVIVQAKGTNSSLIGMGERMKIIGCQSNINSTPYNRSK